MSIFLIVVVTAVVSVLVTFVVITLAIGASRIGPLR